MTVRGDEPPHPRDERGRGPIHTGTLPQQNGWTPREFGRSVQDVPLQAWWPTTNAPTRVVWGAIHGEEVVTLQMLRHLLAVVHADDACAVVVPVLNPDGVLAGTRQNANGVDLNRNFPGDGWRAEPQRSFWSTAVRRPTRDRNQLSSPGRAPGSEPETRAIMSLLEQVAPREVIDVHTPLECVFAFEAESVPLATHLAEPAGLPVRTELEGPTTGDSGSWCRAQGSITATYESELAPMPQLWARHAESLVRMVVDHRG